MLRREGVDPRRANVKIRRSAEYVGRSGTGKSLAAPRGANKREEIIRARKQVHEIAAQKTRRKPKKTRTGFEARERRESGRHQTRRADDEFG